MSLHTFQEAYDAQREKQRYMEAMQNQYANALSGIGQQQGWLIGASNQGVCPQTYQPEPTPAHMDPILLLTTGDEA